MRSIANHAAVAFCLAALCGCGPIKGLPLVFGQAQSVGITITGSAPEQSGELTLGYKDKDLAVIPLDELSMQPSANGTFQDALSVLGQFDVNAKAAPADTSLGKFFATGTAASKLAEGFKCKLGGTASSFPDGCKSAAAAAPAAPTP